MKQTSVLRVTAEICFYYSVLSVIDVFQAWRIPMALFAAACLLIGLVIVRCSSPAARILLAVLPALCFLAGPFRLHMILPLLAWLYYFFVMVRGNYVMPLEDYRKSFTYMLVISLFFMAANIANSTVYSDRFISVDNMVYIFLFLVLGVLAMRRMQMNAEMGLNWQIRNFLSVAGIPLLAAGASLLLVLALRFSYNALTFILRPIGRFFIWLFSKLFPTGNLPVEEMTLEEYMKPESITQVQQELEFGFNSEVDAVGETAFSRFFLERAVAIGGWVLLGILLLLALLLIWRYSKRNRSEAEDELLYEETEAVPAEGKRQRRRSRIPLLAGNARQLRRIYKTYLEYIKGKGISVHASDTSAEILERDTTMSENIDAVRLRNLYLSARYGDPSAVTREQVLEAQACLERITGEA